MYSFLIRAWLNFLRLLLKFIHFVYSGYEYFDLGWLLLKRKCEDFLHISEFDDSQLYVSEFVRDLNKCPLHFAVIVGEEGINLKDFSNIVIWCLAAKISFVSFYDYSGYLKANEHIYYEYLINKRKVDPKCLILDINKLGAKNGVLHKIHLNILSTQDGKPLIVKLAKKLSQNVISNELKVTDINERLIASELHKFSGLPEPDLGIISGNISSTFGFLPWHIRVTEFLVSPGGGLISSSVILSYTANGMSSAYPATVGFQPTLLKLLAPYGIRFAETTEPKPPTVMKFNILNTLGPLRMSLVPLSSGDNHPKLIPLVFSSQVGMGALGDRIRQTQNQNSKQVVQI